MNPRFHFVPVILLVQACSCSDEPGAGPGDARAGEGGSVGMDGGAEGAVAPPPGDAGPFAVDEAGFVLCGTARCECSNGTDDDTDGQADGFDSECTGPYDNDEDSFATGIPGDNRDPDCQDCFFDGNSGQGDDGCRYATSCLTEGNPSSGSGACATCDVDDRCRMNCRPRTPNGCDCFGCCEVILDGGSSVFIQIGGTCSIEEIDDTAMCPRCMQDDECVNECGECELCLGRTQADLPASCYGDGGIPDAGPDAAVPPPYVCADGEQVCGDGRPACPPGEACMLGCCLPVIF